MVNIDIAQRDAEARLNSAVEQTCSTVMTHVAAGRWPGGFTLIEADLVQQLQVSRSTVRESLRRLESAGLVVRRRSRNLVVRRLTRLDVRELYELREILEGHAARLAAQGFSQRPAAQQREFKAAAQWWDRALRKGQVEVLSQANSEFHALVHALSGNSHLPRMLGGTLMTLFVSQFRQRLSDESSLTAAQQHVEIAQAIMDGHPDVAERLMRTHVSSSARYILALPDDAFEADQANPAGSSIV